MNDNSARGWQCLRCGMPFEWDQKRRQQRKKNEVYVCPLCKQKHFVDKMQGHRTTITVSERPELRPRIGAECDDLTEKLDKKAEELAAEHMPDDEENIFLLRRDLLKAQMDAEAWKNAAEGLARQVEILKERERLAEMAAGPEKGTKERQQD